MSGDQLDLDAIEKRAHMAQHGTYPERRCGEMVRTDVPALVAEVRRLREALDLATLMHNRATDRAHDPDLWRGTRP